MPCCPPTRAAVAVTALLYLAGAAPADPPPTARHAAVNALTVDDILATETVGEVRFAPDNRSVVWVKNVPHEKKGEVVSRLVRTDLADRRETLLTRGPHNAHTPRWSPDGGRLAFLSDRPPGEDDEDEDEGESRTRLWCLDPRGGEPWLLLSFPRDVEDFAWLDDDHVGFVAKEKPARGEAGRKEKEDEGTAVEEPEDEPPVRLFKARVEDGHVTRLTRNADWIRWAAFSPDGKYAVALHDRSLSYTYDNKVRPDVRLHDLATGRSELLFGDKNYHVRKVLWRPDSQGFYAVSAHTTHPQFLNGAVDRLYAVDVQTKKPAPVDLGEDRGLAYEGEGLAVTHDGFLALLADGVRPKAARFFYDGKTCRCEWLRGEHVNHMHELRVDAPAQRLLYLYSKASGPRQWYRAHLDGAKVEGPEEVFPLAPDLEGKRLAEVKVERWKGALDEWVEGLLHYPLDYRKGKRYPLVVLIHGGPNWADFDAYTNDWGYPPQLFCQRGAFVLQPNYHGSTHYGLPFAESIAAGKYYDLPVEDIEKGIDHLVAKGVVDAGRVGLSGWSNGAILTMALVTRRPTYRAASAGAGGAEWVADWGACEYGLSFSNYYFGKSPLEDPQLYLKNAPFYKFDRVRTPTLLFQGEADRVVPVHHGWMQYRALQQLGKAPVRYVLFPGEGHALVKLAHQRRKLEEEMAWFDRYLFSPGAPADQTLKPDSPLAHALGLREVSRQGHLYGVTVRGQLVPETVAYEDLRVGRFEVTRAQYARFDPNYAVAAGTENHPANGITLERAKAYCAWLTKVTGEEYRLGTEAELGGLYEGGAATENTLDHWAGYEPTPEDREKLLARVREFPGAAPLLGPVGRFPRLSDAEPLYDVGGNAAEWVTTPDGGRPLGGSADRCADDPAPPPGPAYVGFRVVKAGR